MNEKTLQAISGELLQRKLVSESNLQLILLDINLKTEEKIEQVVTELNKLKDYSLMISFWEQFVNENIITSNKEEQ